MDNILISGTDASREAMEIVLSEISERVYGGRWTEFEPAYAVMKKAGLALPAAHATGYSSDRSLHFILMDYVKGESVREYMVEGAKDEDLHRAVGETCGKLHSVTRDYQGWVTMERRTSNHGATRFSVHREIRSTT